MSDKPVTLNEILDENRDTLNKKEKIIIVPKGFKRVKNGDKTITLPTSYDTHIMGNK